MLSALWQKVPSVDRSQGYEQSDVYCFVLTGIVKLDGSDWIRS